MKRTSLFLLFLVFVVSLSYSQESREVKKTIGLAKDGKVFIDTYKGSITIETWDKPQVDVVARIEPDGWDGDAKEIVERTVIDIDSSAGEVSIKSNYNRLKGHRSWFFGWFDDNNVTLPLIRYTISMPKTARLSVQDYKSESHIRNVHSSIDFNTYKGNVFIAGLEGSLDIETYKGNVDVDWVKLEKDSRFKTYKGDMKITLPKDAAFELDTDFGRRTDFTSDFDAVYHSKRHSGEEEMRGNVNGGGPMLHLSSEKGTYNLRARE